MTGNRTRERGRIRDILWTVGEYDMVCIADFPDEETGVAALLKVGSLGNIRSNTMRAFTAEEMAASSPRPAKHRPGIPPRHRAPRTG